MFEIFVNMESQLSIQSHLRKEAQNRYLLILISTFVKKNSYNKIVTIFN
jgi:hypothetical protein